MYFNQLTPEQNIDIQDQMFREPDRYPVDKLLEALDVLGYSADDMVDLLMEYAQKLTRMRG